MHTYDHIFILCLSVLFSHVPAIGFILFWDIGHLLRTPVIVLVNSQHDDCSSPVGHLVVNSLLWPRLLSYKTGVCEGEFALSAPFLSYFQPATQVTARSPTYFRDTQDLSASAAAVVLKIKCLCCCYVPAMINNELAFISLLLLDLL